jgi:LytS/YehU family sensor histidine kinase
MFIGAVTDLLSVALTAGMFHYGYFIACILFGLLSGMVRVLLNSTKGKQVNFALLSSIVIGAIAIVSIIYVLLLPPGPIEIRFGIKFLIYQ